MRENHLAYILGIEGKMKIIILILLILNFYIYPQIILNDDFSSFMSSYSNDSMIFKYDFDSSETTYDDLSGYGNHLTASASLNFAAGNPMINGGKGLQFDGTNYLYRNENNDPHFLIQPNQDYTFICVLKTPVSWSGNKVLIDVGSSSPTEWWLEFNNSGSVIAGQYANSTAKTAVVQSALVNQLYLFVITIDRDGANIGWRNGDKYISPSPITGFASYKLGDSPTRKPRFGSTWANTNKFNGVIYFAALIKQILSDKQTKEFGFLAYGWKSKNGGVARNNWAFNQGIVADTVYHAIGTAGAAIGRVDAWGASGGETLSVYNMAGDVQTFELTTDSTRYTISSITFSSNDSLFIGSAGTVTVDNVYLETAPDVSPNIYSNNFTGFPEFPDFINDEAIQ